MVWKWLERRNVLHNKRFLSNSFLTTEFKMINRCSSYFDDGLTDKTQNWTHLIQICQDRVNIRKKADLIEVVVLRKKVSCLRASFVFLTNALLLMFTSVLKSCKLARLSLHVFCYQMLKTRIVLGMLFWSNILLWSDVLVLSSSPRSSCWQAS